MRGGGLLQFKNKYVSVCVCVCVCVLPFFGGGWGVGGGGCLFVACFCFLLYSCKEFGLNSGRRKTNTLTCQRDRKEITKGQADL